MLRLAVVGTMKAWERAKINMRNIHDNCRVDISELSTSVLDVGMEAVDNARMKMNAEGEVRAVDGILLVRCDGSCRTGMRSYGPLQFIGIFLSPAA